MIRDVTGILVDGSIPAGAGVAQKLPFEQDLLWPRGEDGTVRLTVLRQNGVAADLTNGSLLLGVRKLRYSAAAAFVRTGTFIDALAGRVDFLVVQADTIGLVEEHEYTWDIWYTDAAGKRWQLVPASTWEVDSIVVLPSDPATAPPAVTPLALGPAWLSHEDQGEYETSPATTAEELAVEFAWNFDDATASLANVFARLSVLAHVTGGSGTLRVRHGGTVGLPDGTQLVASAAITATSYGAPITASATVAKPVGTQLVKVTMQNNTLGQRTRMRGLSVVARGAV